ncbi:Endoribonuclease Dicer 3 [Glycine soja]
MKIGMTEVDGIYDNQEGLGCEYTSQPTTSETSRPDLLSGPHVPAKIRIFCSRIGSDVTCESDKSLFESCEGLQGSKGQNCFVSKITLCISNYGIIESKEEARSDKKTSFDSAVVQMLLEVKRLGKVEIDHLPSS